MKKSIISILTAILLVCTMGLTACNVTQELNDKISSVLPFLHKHAYVKQVGTEDYLVSGATCTQKATYYYSCSCGEKTFSAGVDGENGYKTFTTSTAFTSGWASESFDLIILDVTTTAAGIYSQGIVSNIVLP